MFFLLLITLDRKSNKIELSINMIIFFFTTMCKRIKKENNTSKFFQIE
jgi:hypothetical protein